MIFCYTQIDAQLSSERLLLAVDGNRCREDHTQTLSGAFGSTEEGGEILLKTEVEDTRRTRSP